MNSVCHSTTSTKDDYNDDNDCSNDETLSKTSNGNKDINTDDDDDDDNVLSHNLPHHHHHHHKIHIPKTMKNKSPKRRRSSNDNSEFGSDYISLTRNINYTNESNQEDQRNNDQSDSIVGDNNSIMTTSIDHHQRDIFRLQEEILLLETSITNLHQRRYEKSYIIMQELERNKKLYDTLVYHKKEYNELYNKKIRQMNVLERIQSSIHDNEIRLEQLLLLQSSVSQNTMIVIDDHDKTNNNSNNNNHKNNTGDDDNDDHYDQRPIQQQQDDDDDNIYD